MATTQLRYPLDPIRPTSPNPSSLDTASPTPLKPLPRQPIPPPQPPISPLPHLPHNATPPHPRPSPHDYIAILGYPRVCMQTTALDASAGGNVDGSLPRRHWPRTTARGTRRPSWEGGYSRDYAGHDTTTTHALETATDPA
ncbi:hypothetical protein BJ508DRAFT_418269 [Ascobolus immersus RN42]|uniref:Uncharacterized protein n=1 Tax=Ascobolus immersus RN42 TaxID=1160509 RepID=A0A3N4HMW3_ASCIM|nr:hypothetical protein BJ508DRAFT_418269 [Ascobolus immersus RN42]